MKMELSAFHADAIRESLNIGIGTAAETLAEILKRPVELVIPEVQFMQMSTLRQYLEENYCTWGSCVILPFDGGLKGDGVMVYSSDSARAIIDIIGEVQLDCPIGTAMEADLLMEVGNILVNGCVGSIVNLLGLDTTDGLPRYCSRGGGEVLDELLEQDKSGSFGMAITTSLNLESKKDCYAHSDLLVTFDNSCMDIVLKGFSKLVE